MTTCQNVTLRPFDASDEALVSGWLTDPVTERFAGGLALLCVCDGERVCGLIACDAGGGPVAFLVCERSMFDGVVIAFVVDPARRGQGFGQAAIDALIDHPDYADDDFRGEVSRDNPASLACMRACGFHVDDENGDSCLAVRFSRLEQGW